MMAHWCYGKVWDSLLDYKENDMDKNVNINKEQYVIDIAHIFKSLWHRAWAILLITVLVGGIVLASTVFLVTPKYSSSVMIYVNNSSLELGEVVDISASSLSAAQDLVKSYIVILNTRTTLEQVIHEAGVDYSYGQLREMLSANSVNATEIFRVTVTSTDPYEAAEIAKAVGDVLTERTQLIIEGTTVRIVDYPVVNTAKVSPSITRNTAIGLILGFIGACAVFAVFAILDDTIRDESVILQNYDMPILAKIPDLHMDEGGKKYAYYNSYKSKSDKKQK